jgi:hypothetical protein
LRSPANGQTRVFATQLARLARQHDALLLAYNDTRYTRDHAALCSNAAAPAVTARLAEIESAIDALSEHAARCADSPNAECSRFDGVLPAPIVCDERSPNPIRRRFSFDMQQPIEQELPEDELCIVRHGEQLWTENRGLRSGELYRDCDEYPRPAIEYRRLWANFDGYYPDNRGTCSYVLLCCPVGFVPERGSANGPDRCIEAALRDSP